MTALEAYDQSHAEYVECMNRTQTSMVSALASIVRELAPDGWPLLWLTAEGDTIHTGFITCDKSTLDFTLYAEQGKRWWSIRPSEFHERLSAKIAGVNINGVK